MPRGTVKKMISSGIESLMVSIFLVFFVEFVKNLE